MVCCIALSRAAFQRELQRIFATRRLLFTRLTAVRDGNEATNVLVGVQKLDKGFNPAVQSQKAESVRF